MTGTITRAAPAIASDILTSQANPTSGEPDEAEARWSGSQTSTAFEALSLSGDARPLIGRSAAIAALHRNLERAFSQQQVTLTFIDGAAGMGRTRLLELTSELAARQWLNTRVVYAGCRSSNGGPYAPFSRFLLERFGVTPASSPSQVRADMLRSVGELLGESDAHEIRSVTHLLGHVAGVPFPDSALLAALASSPDERLTRASQALAALFEGDARNRPLLLLLDDMQRAEPQAFSLLKHLLGASRPMAIVVAGDHSIASELAELSELVPTEAVTLQPLTDAEVEALIRALLPRRTITPELLEVLCSRARGNPGAVRELLRALRALQPLQSLESAGTLHARTPSDEYHAQDAQPTPRDARTHLDRADDGHDARDSLATTSLCSEDVQSVVLASLSLLERAVLEWACVIGEAFWDGALLALARSERAEAKLVPWLQRRSEQDQARIQVTLLALEEKGLLVTGTEVASNGLREYRFADAHVRQLLYRELSADVRRDRHAVVARWISVTPQLRRERMHATLGYHYERAGAGHRAQAARAFLDAAQGERLRLRTSVAARYAQRALSLTEASEPATRMSALQEVGELLTTLGHYEAAESAFKELVECAWQLAVPALGGGALQGLARIQACRGEHVSALEHLRQALVLFQSASDRIGIAFTYAGIAAAQRALGDPEAAIAAARRALDDRRARPTAPAQQGSRPHAQVEAIACTLLGSIELDRGHLSSARAHLQVAAQATLPIDSEWWLQKELAFGRLAQHEGQLSQARDRYSHALTKARAMHARRTQCLLMHHLAEIHVALDEPGQAHTLLLKARILAHELSDHETLAVVQQKLALVALALEPEPLSAAQQLTAALCAAREHGSPDAIAAALRGLARVQAHRAHHPSAAGITGTVSADEAECSFRESIRMFEESGNLHEAACTRAELGFHLAERDGGARARTALGEAQAALQPFPSPALERVTRTLEQLGA